ncbi:uncharacterized protein LOC123391040 [Mustela putorius furo]|uniref:Uncharacterized protein LOC123391040 n=1 Tax=Mustela putorius furo TaxID=9669 RepID=A0A8U0RXG6_MUSPF|nr:uncharacterized protein LOC123391040 [Mustela putorius furo]
MASCHATHVAPPRALLTPPPRVARAFARPLKSARRGSARLTEELGVRTRPPTQDARPTVPAGPRLPRVCNAHGGLPGPRTAARVTVPLRLRTLTLGKAAAGAGESEAGGGRPQAVRAREVRRKPLLQSPSPRCGSARRNGAGRARGRRTGGRASRRTGRTGACVLRGPPEDAVPTVRRTAPGRTPHAWSRRRLPRLRGFTYTPLQLRTPWCCHRALRDPEALGGRLRHFTCVCTAVRWCLCKKKLDTYRPHGCMHPEGALRGHRRWPSAHNESGLRRNQFC